MQAFFLIKYLESVRTWVTYTNEFTTQTISATHEQNLKTKETEEDILTLYVLNFSEGT